MQDDARLARIEAKLDQMGEAIVSLARVEERMVTLFNRLDAIDEDLPDVPRPIEDLIRNARMFRDDLLYQTDWAGSSDIVMSTAMTGYRQALRDVPQQTEFPHSIIWPIKPE